MKHYPERICPYCGTKIKGAIKKCPNCGLRIGRGGSYTGYIKIKSLFSKRIRERKK